MTLSLEVFAELRSERRRTAEEGLRPRIGLCDAVVAVGHDDTNRRELEQAVEYCFSAVLPRRSFQLAIQR
ncbi:MAG: hypothetical protein WKG01_06610 [Kofleriaceae bacterium]